VRIVRDLRVQRRLLYNITIRAYDCGSLPLTTDTYLLVQTVAINRNFHAPTFREFVFACRVRENQPARTSVMQVNATDRDQTDLDSTPRHYEIVYSIRNGTGLGRFVIDNNGRFDIVFC